jgi:hypothetical protein
MWEVRRAGRAGRGEDEDFLLYMYVVYVRGIVLDSLHSTAFAIPTRDTIDLVISHMSPSTSSPNGPLPL